MSSWRFTCFGAWLGALLKRTLAAAPLLFGLAMPLYVDSGALEPTRFDGETIWLLAHLSPVYYAVGVSVDDFYVAIFRKAPGEATLAVYINVETYKGPGSYKNAQMFLTVQDGKSYYHWSSDSVSIRVAPKEQFVDLPTVHLEGEPPNTGTEVVTGKLGCKSVAPTPE